MNVRWGFVLPISLSLLLNRRFIDSVSRWHFAPTMDNMEVLHKEGHGSSTSVVGNTVIDSLHIMKKKIEIENWQPKWLKNLSPIQENALQQGKFFLLTLHRRENHDKLPQIILAVKKAMELYPEYNFVLPVHPNPKVKNVVEREFAGCPNITLLRPQDYQSFVWLLSRCRMVLTDSGGLQEEGPALQKPCVVIRDTTEREETIQSGWGTLSGTSLDGIIMAIQKEMETPLEKRGSCPYGDGHSAHYILKQLQDSLESKSAALPTHKSLFISQADGNSTNLTQN